MVSVATIADALASLAGRAYQHERDLQLDVRACFEDAEFDFLREEVLAPGLRVDFLVGAVAVECKVAGGVTPLLRQVWSYAECDQVAEVLIVSTRSAHRKVSDGTVAGKPVHCFYVRPL